MKFIKSFTVRLLVVGVAFFITQCKKDDPGTAPQVTGFNPIAGAAGEVVVITGRNFSTVVTNDKVNFNGTPAFVIDATSTSVTALVPAGATKGRIAVTVNGTTVFSADEFTVFLSQPGITSVSPASGIAGTSVVISGNGFNPTASSNVVKFNGVTADISSATATNITAMVPDGATTGKITVTVSGASSPVTYTSTSDFTIPLPSISNIAPLYGLPGTNVIITGANFNSGTPASNNVTINGTSAAVIAATSTQLTIKVPVLATSGKIKITIGGQSVTSTADYEVLQDIPRTGLIAFYPFDGDAKDDSGNNLDGTLTNSPVLTTDRFGKSNQAYKLDGIDDYITMGNPSMLQISNKITVAGWFNINTITSGPSALITKIDNSTMSGYAVLQDGGVSNPFLSSYYAIDASSSTFNATVSTDVPTSQWIFLVLTADGTSWKFYQNGALKTGTTLSGQNAIPDGTLGDFVIGMSNQNSYFNGSVDDITVYNRSLTDDEIQQLYTQTVSKY